MAKGKQLPAADQGGTSKIMEILLGRGSNDLSQLMNAIIDNHATRGMEVVHEGKKLILPEGTSTEQAIRFLQSRLEDEEREVTVSEIIVAFPLDAAHAMMLVLKEQFGITGSESTTVDTPFGPWKFDPQFISVETSRGVRIQIPWGDFSLPGIDGTVSAGYARKDGRVVFRLIGKVKGRHRQAVTEVANLIREKLKTHSIYRAQAIKVCFRDDEGGQIDFDTSVTPEFMNIEMQEEPIFTATTDAQLEMTVWNPLRYTDRLREIGVSRKRSVLLEGGFGTGKTLAALKTAQIATKSGWTYLYVTHAEDLDRAVSLATLYAPAVVFAEDIDRVTSGNRNQRMDALSYVLDGVDNKEREVMIVLTTNNVEKIAPLMLRPGRIDNVVSIEAPDADVVWRLMNAYGRGRLVGTQDEFSEAIQPMVGQNAAFISEVVKQAQLRSIGRQEPEVTILPDDVLFAVRMMKRHVALMHGNTGPKHTMVPLSELSVKFEHAKNGNGEAQTEEAAF